MYIIISGLLLICNPAFSQNTISGNFPELSGQYVKLVGIEGFHSYIIDSIKVDGRGEFDLSFEPKDYGVGYLVAQDNQPFIVILSNENIKLKGGRFVAPETIEITEGYENKIFEQYASEHPQREQVLKAWGYLRKTYMQDALFTGKNNMIETISEEIRRINAEDSLFLAGLDIEAYVSWYLPVRKLVSSVAVIAQHRAEEIPDAIAAFRNMDYADERLYKSGLLKDAIESHFWLIENSGHALDAAYEEMKISIDQMMENLVSDKRKRNDIITYLFEFLEKRSLFTVSEYLAAKLLNEKGCSIDASLADQLERYRVLKVGDTVSDFAFKGNLLAPGYFKDKPAKLSDIKSRYILLIFGSSWCPACPPELARIVSYYEEWRSRDIEVVFVSLDESKAQFKAFTAIFPFISLCDYQKWESPVVKLYHVYATPTIYLLDRGLNIVLHPDSVDEVVAWINSY